MYKIRVDYIKAKWSRKMYIASFETEESEYLVRHRLTQKLDQLFGKITPTDYEKKDLLRMVDEAAKKMAEENKIEYLGSVSADGMEVIQGIVGIKVIR